MFLLLDQSYRRKSRFSMSEEVTKRLKALTSGSRFRQHKDKKKDKKVKKEIKELDERFGALLEEDKKPPVDMFGRPISENAFDNYESSSDEDVELEAKNLIGNLTFQEFEKQEAQLPVATEPFKIIAIKKLNWEKLSATDIFGIISKLLEERASDLKKVTVYWSKLSETLPKEYIPPTDAADEDTLIAFWRKAEQEKSLRSFAIVNFSTTTTAEIAYNVLIHNEVGDTGAYFDCDVVPDDIDLTGLKIRSEATDIPEDWTLPDLMEDWVNKSKPKEEWDSNSTERKKMIQDAWDIVDNIIDDEENEDAKNIEYQLLASSSSEDESKPNREHFSELIKHLEQGSSEGSESEEQSTEDDIDVKFAQDVNEDEEKDALEDIKKSMIKSKKSKKTGEEPESAQPDASTIDSVLADDRFSDIFAKPGYGIDTSDSKFKATPAMDKYLTDLAKKHADSSDVVDKSESKKPALESTVERIRRRAKEQNKK